MSCIQPHFGTINVVQGSDYFLERVMFSSLVSPWKDLPVSDRGCDYIRFDIDGFGPGRVRGTSIAPLPRNFPYCCFAGKKNEGRTIWYRVPQITRRRVSNNRHKGGVLNHEKEILSFIASDLWYRFDIWKKKVSFSIIQYKPFPKSINDVAATSVLFSPRGR